MRPIGGKSTVLAYTDGRVGTRAKGFRFIDHSALLLFREKYGLLAGVQKEEQLPDVPDQQGHC
jgi:hypothetical protein